MDSYIIKAIDLYNNQKRERDPVYIYFNKIDRKIPLDTVLYSKKKVVSIKKYVVYVLDDSTPIVNQQFISMVKAVIEEVILSRLEQIILFEEQERQQNLTSISKKAISKLSHRRASGKYISDDLEYKNR